VSVRAAIRTEDYKNSSREIWQFVVLFH
jgi:hypothetical protein